MIQAYLDWLVGTALPFWAEQGFDREGGRFHERLDLAGRPVDVPHRLMVQARQIYVFAHAAELGWFPRGDELALRAVESLRRDFGGAAARGAFAFAIDHKSGSVVSRSGDAYAHAFLLFALAWLHRRIGDPALLETADRIFDFIDAALLDPVNGGLYDTDTRIDRSKRQNPLMHLLEACLALETTAPGRGYLERAGKIVLLFRKHLFRPQPGLLIEHFDRDWQPHPEAGRRDVWEPGHHFEWVWLLAEHARLAKERLDPRADTLFAVAQAHGLAPDGAIYDELGADLGVRKRAHRLWPHTEAIKAAAVRGDPGFANHMANILFNRFLGRPIAAGWIDQVDAAGEATVNYIPASSLYHLFFAGAEAARVQQLVPRT